MKFEFETDIAPTTKGMQPTKYDCLLEQFPKDCEPGKRLLFDESVVSRQAASNAAKRLMALDGCRRFHSGFDVVKKKTFIRVRPEGELVDAPVTQADLDIDKDLYE